MKWSSSCIKAMTSHNRRECKDESRCVIKYLSQINCQYDKSCDEIILTKFFYNLEMQVMRLKPNKFGGNGYIISTRKLENPTFSYASEFCNFNCYVDGLMNLNNISININDELTGTSHIYESLLNIEKSDIIPYVASCVWHDIGQDGEILLLCDTLYFSCWTKSSNNR